MTGSPLPVVVLISGSGSNLQAFIDGRDEGSLPIDIRAVISNKPEAYGLVRAEQAGIPTRVLPHRDFDSREAYDEALRAMIDEVAPELVILAGFMRILSTGFVDHYQGRLINIHPSLLPAFRGLDTHQRALAAGVREHGCSVHFVTPDLDAGPVIVQGPVAVHDNDDPQSLAERVHGQEHRVYPLAVRWLAEGRVEMRGERAYLDGMPLVTAPRLEPGQDPGTL
ncbi:phosphoribosylglycinamide formyltransferase [Alkalilimnicola sp. S0819]|uniref:phosphoribosylglycinamide formyltransferase n=1 Tax=Alkalilimnicola sp. S0819 TaxID=2613922 RepID=UPI0012618CD1|nr:phosphoribosylglycinamide formyltransferase [Alkalilimnicola sp. S0819]KAB7623206.1 phosphoribosylglycinamide formyltransferase [Alkalilimnicola sp. S0819]MPQ17053.1 phosphoribosylglycinamide formyltransferase [Alkalilimnicola sp. S0819]